MLTTYFLTEFFENSIGTELCPATYTIAKVVSFGAITSIDCSLHVIEQSKTLIEVPNNSFC